MTTSRGPTRGTASFTHPTARKMANSREKRRGPCLHRSEVFGQSINCRLTGWCESKWCSLETTRASSFSCLANWLIDWLIDWPISDFDVCSFGWLLDWSFDWLIVLFEFFLTDNLIADFAVCNLFQVGMGEDPEQSGSGARLEALQRL